MKKSRIIVILLAVAMALAAAGLFFLLGREDPVLFHVEVRTETGEEKLSYRNAGGGNLQVFLPGYGDLSQMSLSLHTQTPLYLGDRKLENGMTCEQFTLGETYPLRYSVFGEARTGTVTFYRSGGVATMYLDTQSGSMDIIHKEKGNEESGTLRLYGTDGALQYSGDVKSFNGRGNSSWARYDKKAYSITLLNEADLLGMGSAWKWILLANADDRSNMRNQLIYDFAKDVGLAWSPEADWVDLYLNGEYTGLYQLSERNEVHANRVDIAHEDSFLLSMEFNSNLTSQNIPAITTQSGKMLRIHYSRDLSDGTIREMTDLMNSVENALEAADGVDPVTGKSWQELIDVPSWARKYLVEEIFGNIDAGRISQFFYYDRKNGSDKVFAGPVWDYDHAIGNVSEWQLRSPNALLADRPEVDAGYYDSWYHLLARKEAFMEQVAEIYRVECRPLLQDMVENRIDACHDRIVTACRMDEARWAAHPREIEVETADLKTHLEARMAFLDRLWIDREPYHLVRAESQGDYRAFYAIFDGECLTELPDFAERTEPAFLGWYHKESGAPFDPSVPITEDTVLTARWEEKEEEEGISLTLLVNLVPPGVIAMMGLALLLADRRRNIESR